MNDARKKFGIAALVILLILVVSFSLSTVLNFEGKSGTDKIVVIPIRGTITSGDSSTILNEATISPDTVINFIDQAEKDESIKGIILEINSPGGGALASKEIAEAVKRTRKPTVAVIREVGASGGYWIASAADKIIADELSITGSIGVTSSYIEFADLMEKYGITYEELKSGKYKESGSPFRKLTEDERSMLQEKVDKIQGYFLDEVRKNRNLDEKTMEKVKEAEIYLGKEAYDLKLVDQLGGMELAVNTTKELAKIKEAKIIRYEQKKSILDVLGLLSAEAYYNIGRGIGFEMIRRELTQNTLEIRS